MNNDFIHEWQTDELAGLSPSLAAELRRLNFPEGPFAMLMGNVARDYEERELSVGPVRAVLRATYPRGGWGLLTVTDQDVVAFGRGPRDSLESTVIAKEWISDVIVRWRRRSGRITILLRDSGGRYETKVTFKGSSATSDIAKRWRLAALSSANM